MGSHAKYLISSILKEKKARLWNSYPYEKAKQLGATLGAPFMTLSFMALLVIPSLKLSDKGLFDGKSFSFTALLK